MADRLQVGETVEAQFRPCPGVEEIREIDLVGFKGTCRRFEGIDQTSGNRVIIFEDDSTGNTWVLPINTDEDDG